MNRASTVCSLNRAISGLSAAGLAAGLLAAPPADARDRPGTPNNERAWACGSQLSELPRICVEFDNTASERVTFEAEVTRNGVKFPPHALSAECLTRPHLPHACQAADAINPGRRGYTDYKTGEKYEDGSGWEPQQGFFVTDVEPGVQYCFRFKARRVSDQVVSERWSNWACAAGVDLPPKPLPPSKVSAKYMQETWHGNVPYPGVVVKWAGVRNASRYTVSGYANPHDGWTRNQQVDRWTKTYPGNQLADTIIVSPDIVAAGGGSVEVCAHNISGTACTRTVIDRLVDPAHHRLGTRTPAADALRQNPVLEKTSQPKPAPGRPEVSLEGTRTPKDLLRTQSAAAGSILRAQPKVLQQSIRFQQPAPVPTPTAGPSVLAPQRGSLAASVFRPAAAATPVAPQAPGGLRPNAAVNGTCQVGFVWREARPSDHVCVTPQSRARIAGENSTAGSRLNPGGGAYGPNTCRPGYVWREAFAGDLVCVEPHIRAAVREENVLASSRVLK